jgi:hypothetical protein
MCINFNNYFNLLSRQTRNKPCPPPGLSRSHRTMQCDLDLSSLLQSGIVTAQVVFPVATGIDGSLLQCVVVTSNFTSAGKKNSSHEHADVSMPVATIFYSSNGPLMSVARRYCSIPAQSPNPSLILAQPIYTC